MDYNAPPAQKDSPTLPTVSSASSVSPHTMANMEYESPWAEDDDDRRPSTHRRDSTTTDRRQAVESVSGRPSQQQEKPGDADWQELTMTLLETVQKLAPPRPTMPNPADSSGPFFQSPTGFTFPQTRASAVPPQRRYTSRTSVGQHPLPVGYQLEEAHRRHSNAYSGVYHVGDGGSRISPQKQATIYSERSLGPQ